VVERLLKEGATVTLLVRPESNLWRLADVLSRVSVMRTDFLDLTETADAIFQFKPDAVFHLAWQGVTSAYKNDPEQITVNVSQSLDLFAMARAAGCKLWLGIGSQAEYGPHDEILSEETPVQPVTAYGTAKLCVGLLTKKLCELAGMRYVWLRLLATYGPRDDERHLIPSAIRCLLAGERPALTNGEQLWDYLYVEDAAEAICRCAVNERAEGVFNLASGEAHSVRSILELIRDLIDPSLPLGFGEAPYPPHQPKRLQASIDRLRSVTGWTPRLSIDEGLRHTVDWYKVN
jgi:nucleoside-diphosphate-sugar epimerase